MRYWIVFITTLVALFFDEFVITICSMIFNKKISVHFIMLWTVLSGIIATLFVSMHLPHEYQTITMILIGVAVLFSIEQQHKNDNHSMISKSSSIIA
jgi:hypothetical protein